MSFLKVLVIKFFSGLIIVLNGTILFQNAFHRPALHLMQQCKKDHKHDDLLLGKNVSLILVQKWNTTLLRNLKNTLASCKSFS